MSAEYVELNRSFITRHQGGRVHEHMYDSASVWLSDQEAPHPSLCSDTNLASATLWLLFKLARTQGSTQCLSTSNHDTTVWNSLSRTWLKKKKITWEINVRGSFDLNGAKGAKTRQILEKCTIICLFWVWKVKPMPKSLNLKMTLLHTWFFSLGKQFPNEFEVSIGTFNLLLHVVIYGQN